MHGTLISPHVLDCHKTSAKSWLYNWPPSAWRWWPQGWRSSLVSMYGLILHTHIPDSS
jgi:hypothetical protein